jgi:hypothetical protein
MKTKRNSLLLFTAFILVFSGLLTSCSTTDGIGPKGEQGPPGDANIQTHVYTINPSEWIAQDTLTEFYRYANIQTPYITQRIYDSGVVLVYLYNGTDGWMGLPYTEPLSATTHECIYGVGGVTFWVLSSFASPITDTVKFKVVVIPGSSTRRAYIPPKIDTKDYLAVKSYYHLEE